MAISGDVNDFLPNPVPMNDLLKVRFMRRKEQRERRELNNQSGLPGSTSLFDTSVSGANDRASAEVPPSIATSRAPRRQSAKQVYSPTSGGRGGLSGGNSVPAQSQLPKARRIWPCRRKYNDLLVSTVAVSARVAKVKAELLNILFVIPSNIMRWPPVQDGHASHTSIVHTMAQDAVQGRLKALSSARSIQPGISGDDVKEGKPTPAIGAAPLFPVGTEAMEVVTEENVAEGNQNHSTNSAEVTTLAASVEPVAVTLGSSRSSDAQPTQQVSVERQRYRDADRFARNKMLLDLFISYVQNADTVQKVSDCVILLEELVPTQHLKNYPWYSFPILTDNIAVVALRLFSLDRFLHYENIPIDAKANPFGKAPRAKYSPRCLFSTVCLKSLCHGGRCNNNAEGFSRFVEIQDGFGVTSFNPTSAGGGNGPSGGPIVGMSSNDPSSMDRQPAPQHAGGGTNSVQYSTSTGLLNQRNLSYFGGNPSMQQYGGGGASGISNPRGQDHQLFQRNMNSIQDIGFKAMTGMVGSGGPGAGDRGDGGHTDEDEEDVLNLDAVQPYVPKDEEVNEMEWV